MSDTQNPLKSFYRTPKKYLPLPTQGKFYANHEIDESDSGYTPDRELAIYSMTARDEMIMKNPEALLNGEAVAQVISSCVPAVKNPRHLVNNDVEAILVAINGATYGDEITIEADCPQETCNGHITASASVDACIEGMTLVEKTYKYDSPDGLSIEIRPFSFDASVKAGKVQFQATRSLQALSDIQDEEEQLKFFNKNFQEMALMNFEMIVDSVASITGQDDQGEDFIVTSRDDIQSYLENCDSSIGKAIEERVQEVNNIGIQKSVELQCPDCEHVFDKEISFDPVNFSTASSDQQNQKK